MRRFLFLLPVIVFVTLVCFLALRLTLIEHGNTPDLVPSVMIGKPVPAFDLPIMNSNKRLRSADIPHTPVVLNFFSSWCVPCRAEHPLIKKIHNAGTTVVIGVNYKDKPKDVAKWLNELGNPYDTIAIDADGRAAIDFGLYGVPETYVIDKNGIIRFKQTGPLTPEVVRNELMPLLKRLNQ